MSKHDLSEDLKHFIFSHIDSVEQLEMLMLLRQDPEKLWTPRQISEELRTSSSSVSNRIKKLVHTGLITENESSAVRYRPSSDELAQLVNELAEVYKVRKHFVLELIFSPMKRARHFADAFVIKGSYKKDEDSNG